MASIADLKGALARMDEMVERVEEIRLGLNETQIAALTVLRENTDSMRDDLHELLMSKPDAPEEYFPPLDPETQASLDASVSTLNEGINLLQNWLPS